MSKPNVVKRLNHMIQRVDTSHVELIGTAIEKGEIRCCGMSITNKLSTYVFVLGSNNIFKGYNGSGHFPTIDNRRVRRGGASGALAPPPPT